MWLKWLPWKYLIRRWARNNGFLDPLVILARLRRFAQPSEIDAPMELLRAGVAFHARGLINTAAIQHNLDWVWPYWIQRQFDPLDDAFMPRSFSLTHINLSHRNWTALGVPDCDALPIVDPRGLLTPFLDGWSLDAWIVTDDKRELIPSRCKTAHQYLDMEANLAVVTETHREGLRLSTRAEVMQQDGLVVCRQRLIASADCPAWLAVTLRPYNPEGISLIHTAALDTDAHAWSINKKRRVRFSDPVDRHHISNYRHGDVYSQLHKTEQHTSASCDVGMITAAAMFKLQPHSERQLTVDIPLNEPVRSKRSYPAWPTALEGYAKLSVPDTRFQFLYEAALRSLILHSPAEVYAGPYTYKRFWFRDAAFILHALLCAGLTDRVECALRQFSKHQTRTGYFLSQDGEWDSNGEALWIMQRYCALSGRPPQPELAASIRNGARWILRKRLADTLNAPHAGLFPPGFSAEHLGPNDFYYWDDFWGVAGLRAAADMLTALGDQSCAAEYLQGADRLMAAIERSLAVTAPRRERPGIPASPYRRMDGGAIGSLVAGYPLGLYSASDRRLLDSADFLLENCFVAGGFFQDLVHSGINMYLTMHVAQVLLRAGDPRCVELLYSMAELATPTGQWPEAIHPRTRGGCMGDGQHIWAAAEWVMMLRNCFVREEGERLILASGIPPAWLSGHQALSFGPAPTPFGAISVRIEPQVETLIVSWQADWRGAAPPIEIRALGLEPVLVSPGHTQVTLVRRSSA